MPSSADKNFSQPLNETTASEEACDSIEELNQAELDQADSSRSADSREEAVEVVADPTIDDEVRQEVAERLEQADNHMTLKYVDPEDSY